MNEQAIQAELVGPREAVRCRQGLPRVAPVQRVAREDAATAVICDLERHARDRRLVSEARLRAEQVHIVRLEIRFERERLQRRGSG
jgi:hypothetical protein